MVKFSTFLTRRPDLTRAEFSRYWKEKHAPFLENFPEVERYVRRYVQQVTMIDLPDTLSTTTFDGVAELWFDSVEDFNAFAGSFKNITSVTEDEKNFIDRTKTVSILSKERFGLWKGKD